MHEDSLPSANLKKARKLSSLTLEQMGDRLWMGGMCERRRCQTSLLSQLEAGRAELNSFEAENAGGQGSITGGSAVGGMDIY